MKSQRAESLTFYSSPQQTLFSLLFLSATLHCNLLFSTETHFLRTIENRENFISDIQSYLHSTAWRRCSVLLCVNNLTTYRFGKGRSEPPQWDQSVRAWAELDLSNLLNSSLDLGLGMLKCLHELCQRRNVQGLVRNEGSRKAVHNIGHLSTKVHGVKIDERLWQIKEACKIKI